jgi:hypothetical protein
LWHGEERFERNEHSTAEESGRGVKKAEPRGAGERTAGERVRGRERALVEPEGSEGSFGQAGGEPAAASVELGRGV